MWCQICTLGLISKQSFLGGFTKGWLKFRLLFLLCYSRPRIQFWWKIRLYQAGHPPPPGPENLLSKAPNSLNTRPFVQLLSPSRHFLQTYARSKLCIYRWHVCTPPNHLGGYQGDTEGSWEDDTITSCALLDTTVMAALPEGTVFPLKTVSDIEAMEQKLADPTFHKEVVCHTWSITYLEFAKCC